MLPQILFLILMCVGLGMCIADHGKPKEGEENAVISVISTAVIFGLLFWGGFFDVFFS